MIDKACALAKDVSLKVQICMGKASQSHIEFTHQIQVHKFINGHIHIHFERLKIRRKQSTKIRERNTKVCEIH